MIDRDVAHCRDASHGLSVERIVGEYKIRPRCDPMPFVVGLQRVALIRQ
jgi:hypothetical protein